MSSVVISGDTSGAITLASPAVAGTNTATLPAATGTVLLSSTTGVCQAWVNFTGSGSTSIQASYNVSSVTYVGTGSYVVNFTNAFADTKYATTHALQTSSLCAAIRLDTVNTTSVAFRVGSYLNIATDAGIVCIACFR